MSAPQPTEPESPSKPPGIVLSLGFSGDDVALVAALREGHPGAKAALFERYAPYVERLITHVIGFDQELSDILQEVFLQALKRVHALENPRALKAWLAQVTTSTARRTLRTRKRRAWLRLFVDPDEETRWERPAAGSDEGVLRALRAVYAVLDELPADERIVFALRFVESMELGEIAVACGVSRSTVQRRLQRAQRRFATAARKRPELAERLEGGSRWHDR